LAEAIAEDKNPRSTDKKVNMKKEHRYHVYILASKRKGTLYIGMTNNVLNRNFQHKTKLDKNSFTAKYSVDKLVYYEVYKYVNDAIQREKELKRYKRKWKIELIEKENPEWKDLL